MKQTHVIIGILAMITLQITVLLWLGHPVICKCETLRFWDGAVRSAENSQHILDWYSISHFIFGFLVYFTLWLMRIKFNWPKTIVVGFLILVFVSSSWEIFENTRYAIHRFQENTISYEYRGDSVVNTLSDTAVMFAGFWLASLLPVWVSIMLVVALEFMMMAVTRDGLILHSLMFTYPIKSIFHWQASLTR